MCARNFVHFIFSAMSNTLFCLYSVWLIYFIAPVFFFSSNEERASGEMRECTATDSAAAASLMLLCLFSDKCFECENRKLLINKRHKKSQFSLAPAKKNTIERCPELLKCFLSFQETKVCRIQEVVLPLLLLPLFFVAFRFYLVSKIHSLCQRLSTHTRLLVSFKGILTSLKSHSFKCYSFFRILPCSKTAWLVHVGRFRMVINVRAFWNANICNWFLLSSTQIMGPNVWAWPS